MTPNQNAVQQQTLQSETVRTCMQFLTNKIYETQFIQKLILPLRNSAQDVTLPMCISMLDTKLHTRALDRNCRSLEITISK
jgi:hypothetical protein